MCLDGTTTCGEAEAACLMTVGECSFCHDPSTAPGNNPLPAQPLPFLTIPSHPSRERRDVSNGADRESGPGRQWALLPGWRGGYNPL